MKTTQAIIDQLHEFTNKEKALQKEKFFQTHPGGYGEGDLFMGATNPEVKSVFLSFIQEIDDQDLKSLILHPIHEVRMGACYLLVALYQKARKDKSAQKHWVDFYLKHLEGINNWDLVDTTCYKILGDWLLEKDKTTLYVLAESGDLWKERVAIVSTLGFIKKDQFDDAIKLCEQFIHHDKDIIHKAVGWVLKEMGKRNKPLLEQFIKRYYDLMPRTILRIAIEKFTSDERKAYLTGCFL